MKFLKIKVVHVLAAAACESIDPTDTIDSLILQNAQRHQRSLPGAVLNVSEAIAHRVDALLGPEGKSPAPESQPFVAESRQPITEPEPVIPEPEPVIPETVIEQPVVEEPVVEEPVVAEPVVEEPVVEEPVVAEDVSKETAAE